MSCEPYRTLLSAGFDGELSAEEQAQLDAHLAECKPCRQRFESYGRISAVLRADAGNAPPALWDRIAAQAGRPTSTAAAWSRRIRPVAGPLAAAAGFLVYVLLFIGVADRSPGGNDVATLPVGEPPEQAVSAEQILSHVQSFLGEELASAGAGERLFGRPENQFVMALVQEVNR